MLIAKDLCFSYGKRNILKNVNFMAEKGQVISLIGPNGSGKSTLLRCLCGLISVKNNSVFLFDKPIETLGSKEISRKIAFLPQAHERLQGVTVYELISSCSYNVINGACRLQRQAPGTALRTIRGCTDKKHRYG